MGKSKNIYVEDLSLQNIGDIDFIEVINRGDKKFSCYIERVDTEVYKIFDVESSSPDLLQLVERRYAGNNYGRDVINIRLRDMQYEVRKEFKKWGKKTEPQPEAVPAEPVPTQSVPVPSEPTPAPRPKVEMPKFGLERQIFELVVDGIASDETQEVLKKSLKEQLDIWGYAPASNRTVKIQIDDCEIQDAGQQHEEFETVLRTLKAGCNLALVGPAGSGKTTVVAECAKILNLPFYAKSVSAQTAVHEFFGYTDANGNYVRTLFREAFEFGGVFLLDEFDAGNPNVLASMNAATANGYCAFADGMVHKHENFIIVMAGNTFGHGATTAYVGRNKIDEATLDRFVFLPFNYDENLEYLLAPNKEWCKKVQAMRKMVEKKKIRAIVSPRATFNGAKLLAAGISETKVYQMTIYKGLNPDEVALLKEAEQN